MPVERASYSPTAPSPLLALETPSCGLRDALRVMGSGPIRHELGPGDLLLPRPAGGGRGGGAGGQQSSRSPSWQRLLRQARGARLKGKTDAGALGGR